jgi:hypothetical protein
MSDLTEAQQPSSRVLPHELPAALRDAGLVNWIREPLDDAVDRRRRIIFPPAAAVLGTPAHGYQGALLAEVRHPDTVFMMGDNPALPTMPERPERYKHYHLRTVPERYREHVDVRTFGTGERIVFLPYTREVFAATRAWTQAHNLFPELSQPAAGYDEAALA